MLLLKGHVGWPRSLKVRVEQDGRSRRLRFPEDAWELSLPDVRQDRPCMVTVESMNPLKRVLGRRQTYSVAPSTARLRAVIAGSGRCGTTSIARYLDGLRFCDGTPVRSRHQTLDDYLIEPVARGDCERATRLLRSLPHDVESAPYVALLPEIAAGLKLVQLVRDGRRVVQSGLIRGWYQDDSFWNRFKPKFPGDAFAQSCQFWVHVNRKLEPVAGLRVRLEDLSTSDKTRRDLLNFLEIEPTDRVLPQANLGKAPSRIDEWTDAQHETFAEICGDLMDSYYPGWAA